MQAALPKSVSRAQAASLELFTALGETVLQSASELAPLGVETVRGALNEAATLATTLPAAKTPQDVVNLQNTFAEALRDSATQYSRSFYEVAVETQGKLNRLIEAHIAEVQKGVQEAIDEATSAAPAGTTGLVDFFKTFANAGASTYQQASKSLREAADAAVATATAPAASRKGKATA